MVTGMSEKRFKIITKNRCLDCMYCYSIAEDFFVCDHSITDKEVFNPDGVTECSSWREKL